MIFSNSACGNTIGGITAGSGQPDRASTSGAGSRCSRGPGNSILSNSIFSNGQPGDRPGRARRPGQRRHAEPAGRPRRAQRPPELPGPDLGQLQRHGHAHRGDAEQPARTTFLIQFFTSKTADPWVRRGRAPLLARRQVTTDGAGNAVIDADPAASWLSRHVVLDRDGDQPGHRRHLRVLRAIPESPAIQFTAATYTGHRVERLGRRSACRGP